VGIVMCRGVYVWVLLCVGVCMCGYCYVWGCVCVGFVMCGCFGNMCTCIYCVFIVCTVFLYCFVYVYLFLFVLSVGTRGGIVVKALRYKPAGRGFDSRWCHWNFSVT
jgi:hypothetical protein